MADGVLYLTDAHLALSHDKVIIASCGQAYLAESGLIFGHDAFEQSRLHPVECEESFWSLLDYSSLKQQHAQAQHQADLVYYQLLHLHQQVSNASIINILTPDIYSAEQLSLLLGIIEHADFNVPAIINSALVACYGKPAGEYLVVEVLQHQIVCSKIKVGQEITLESTEVVNGAGLLDWYNHWANLIASHFIHQLRFDPFRRAENEQALFNQLPALFLSPSSQDNVEVALEGQKLNISKHQLTTDSARLSDKISHALARVQHVNAILVHEKFIACPMFNNVARQLQSFSDPELVKQSQAIASKVPDNQGQFRVISQIDAPTSTTQAPVSQQVKAPAVIVSGKFAYTLPNRGACLVSRGDSFHLCALNQQQTSGICWAELTFQPTGQLQLTAKNDGIAINGKAVGHSMELVAGDVILLANGMTFQLLAHGEVEG